MIPSSEFQNRRRKLLDLMDDDSILVAFSGVPKISSADEELPFEVNRNFHYLTGISQQNSVLLLAKTMGETKEFLFILSFRRQQREMVRQASHPRRGSREKRPPERSYGRVLRREG